MRKSTNIFCTTAQKSLKKYYAGSESKGNEPWTDAILVSFGVSNNALLDIISGAAEPYGLLPCQLPADMKTVEEQCEDVPRDMRCYVDSEGNT